MVIICFLLETSPLCHAQTNVYGVILIDSPPIDGKVDLLMGGLTIGQQNEPGFFGNGLCRARLVVQLPPMPPSSQLAAATLSLYLEHNTGSAGNPTFGPLSLYHNFHPNSVQISDTDYADTNYLLVTSSVIAPASPPGQYYDFDVTAQVTQDYASDGPTPVSDFRFQVDGLAFIGGSHFYEFYFAQSENAVYPVRLNLQFLTAAPPPTLSLSLQTTPPLLKLHWPDSASDYILESANSVTSTWSAVTNRPTICDGECQVSLEAAQTQQFFRLHRQ